MDLLNEGMQCMLVQFFVHKAAWLKFTAVNTDCTSHTKYSQICYAVICESMQPNKTVDNQKLV